MKISPEMVLTWFPIGICIWACALNYSMIAFMCYFSERPKWVKLYSFVFAAGHVLAICLVGKLWEAIDLYVHLKRINGLVFGLSMLFFVYLLPSAFSAVSIKPLFPKAWQKCDDFYQKNRRK
jgi:hypothetical protein